MKIREQLPERSDTRALSPPARVSQTRRVVPDSRGRRPRATTAPGCVEDQTTRRQRSTDARNEYRTALSQAQRGGEQNSGISQVPLDACPEWDNAEGGGRDQSVLESVVSLGEAVADFDVALRHHRNKRRGRTSSGALMNLSPSSAGGAENSRFPDDELFLDAGTSETLRSETERLGAGSSVEDKIDNTCGWSDGNDAAWTEITPIEAELANANSALQWTKDEESGRQNAGENQTKVSNTAPMERIPADTTIPQQQQPPGSEGDRKLTPSVQGMAEEVVKDSLDIPPVEDVALGNTAVDKARSLDDDNKSCVDAGRTGQQGGYAHSLLRSHDSPVDGNIRDPRATNQMTEAEPSKCEDAPPAQAARDICTIPDAAGIDDRAPTTTKAIPKPQIEVVPLSQGGPPTADVSDDAPVAAANTAAVASPTTPGETEAQKADFIFPAAADAMQSPDPISTSEQRTTRTWMTAGYSPQTTTPPDDCNAVVVPPQPLQLPCPLTSAEAEANLEGKINALRSKKEASEREEEMMLDQKLSEKLGGEQAERAHVFAEEDRQLLADEEGRLAQIRRQADLDRLQQGAEFEEAEETLVRSGVVSEQSPGTSSPAKEMLLQGKVTRRTLNDRKDCNHPERVLEGERARVKDYASNTRGGTSSSQVSVISATEEGNFVDMVQAPLSVPHPVRGMRPQHYTEAEDLPPGVKQAAAHKPADEVLDGLESLANRARAAGKGVNIEEFEQVCVCVWGGKGERRGGMCRFIFARAMYSFCVGQVQDTDH